MENQIVLPGADAEVSVEVMSQEVAHTSQQGQSAEPQAALKDAVAEVAAGNSEAINLVQLALDGKAENLSPEQAQQVQSILEAAKQLLSASPQAAQLLENVQSSLRPVIQAQLNAAQDNSGPAVSEVSGSAGTLSGASEPEVIAPASSEGSSQTAFTPSVAGRIVAPSLGQSVEPANARVLAPFVQQPVRADGQFGGSLEISGQVGNLADLSGQLAAGSVGGGSVSQLLDTIVAQEAPTATESPAEPPPPPVGKVSIRTEQASEFKLETGQSESQTFRFILTRTDATANASVTYSLKGITKDALVNPDTAIGSVSFRPGQATATLDIVVKGNNIQESNKTFEVVLGNTVGLLELGGGALSAKATIGNDDSIFQIESIKTTQLEGAIGELPDLVFKITRNDTTVATSVNWVLEGLAANSFPNQPLPSGTVSFAAGQSEALVTLKPFGDNIVEKDYTATLRLTGVSNNGVINPDKSFAETKILDEDSVFSVTALQASQLEGSIGESPTLTYTITRDKATVPSTIKWQLTGLTAAELAQGTPTSGEITFAAGQTQATVLFNLRGDNIVEAQSVARLTLTEAISNATISPDQSFAETTIADDDCVFSVTAVQASQLESALAETRTLTYTITRDRAVVPGTIKWQLTGLTAAELAQGTATAGEITFAAGQTEATVQFTVVGDNIVEPQSVARLTLTEAISNSTISPTQSFAETTITDDDSVFSVAAAQASQLEGAAGETRTLTYTITRDKSIVPSTIKWQLTGLTAAELAQGSATNGEIIFAAGQTSATVQFTVVGDNTVEAHSTARLTLTEAISNSTVSPTQSFAETVISDDDSVISVSAKRASQPEGQPTQTRTLEFTITRTDATVATSVDWALTGLNAADFGGTLPKGTVQFTAGQLTSLVQIQTKTDYDIEASETATIQLSNHGSNSTIHTQNFTASTLVTNDDLGYFLTAVTSQVTEGAQGSFTTVTFKVQRTEPLNAASSVRYEVAGYGTPVGADSFKNGVLPSGIVEFASGESEKLITFDVAGNDRVNGVRNFSVVLKEPSAGSRIIIGQALGSITDDDSLVSISAVTAEVNEGHTGTVNTVFKATRSGTLSSAQTLQWKISGLGELAVAGGDFEVSGGQLTGQITFAAGQSEVLITIPVKGNSLVQPDKVFTMDLVDTAGNNLDLLHTQAQVKIVNDDSSLSIRAQTTDLVEGNPGGTAPAHQFVIERGGYLGSSVTVAWQLASRSETLNADDFGGTIPSGTVTFAANETSKIIEIRPSADSTVETLELFKVDISSTAPGVQILQASANGRIFDDEAIVQFQNASATLSEGNPARTGNFITISSTVTRSGYVLQDGTVQWRLVPIGDHPVVLADFVTGQDSLGSNNGLPSGTLTFGRGAFSADISVKVVADSIEEFNEQFRLELINPSSGHNLGNQTTSSFTINNDDATFALSGNTSAAEGHLAANQAHTFTVTRSGDLSSADSVRWKLVLPNGGATASDFFGLTAGKLEFLANETQKTFQITTIGDDVIEANKNFSVELYDASVGSAVKSDASSLQVTLKDDDIKVQISGVTVDALEGNDTNGNLRFKLTREGDLTRAATLNWTIAGSGSTPASAQDFVATSGQVEFTAGSSEAFLDVAIKADQSYTADSNGVAEGYTLTLSTPAPGNGIVLGTATTVSGTILNDDQIVNITGPSDAQELATGQTVDRIFTVTRAGKTDQASTLQWAVDSTSTATANDFVGGALPTGSVTFAAGETSKTITIQTVGDALAEGNETVVVKITSTGGNDFTNQSATTTILDDDIAISIAPQSATVNEGNQGVNTSLPFIVSRTGDLSASVQMNWTATGDTAGLAQTTGTVTLGSNQQQVVLNLTVAGNSTVGTDRNITVTLDPNNITTTPTGGRTAGSTTLATGSTALTIKDDDAKIAIASDTATSVVEGTSSEGDPAFHTVSVTVNRTGESTSSKTVTWKIVPTGTDPVTASDFVIPQGGTTVNGFPSGTLTFTDNQSKTIEFQVKRDADVELSESFQIVLESTAQNLELGSAHTMSITADDPGFGIVALNETQAEGNSGNTAYTFKIVRINNTSGTNTINYAVTGTGNNPANAADFGGTLPSGSVTFLAGEAEKTITINVSGDTTIEETETFKVTLSNLPPGNPAPSVTATITTDDTLLAASAVTASVTEGNSGSQTLTFEVTRSGVTTAASTVNWEIDTTGTATSADFSSGQNGRGIASGMPSGTISFAAGETSKQVNVTVLGDSVFEANETVPFKISSPSGTQTITTATATATINNDDAEIYFDNTSVSVLEGDSGTQNITFTIRRGGNTSQTTTLNWGYAGISTSNSDFTFDTSNPSSGSLTFNSGDTSKTVTFKVVGDTGATNTNGVVISSVEGDETFRLNLSGLSAGSGFRDGHSFATGTIIDNDQALILTHGNLSLAEKAQGQGNTDYVWTVSRSGYTTSSASATWSSSGGNSNPANATDISGGFKTNQTLNWTANNTDNKTITVSSVGDNTREENEEFKITLNGLDEFDHIQVNGVKYVISGNSYSSFASILRDEANYVMSNLTLTQGSSSSLYNGTSLNQSGFPVEGTTGQNHSVWFQIHRDISQLGAGYVDWKLTSATVSDDSTNMSTNHNLFYVEHSSSGVNATDFVTADVLGTNGGLPSGTVNFADGERYKWVEVVVSGDNTTEELESFRIALTNTDGDATTGSSFEAGNKTGYIRPNEPIFSLMPKDITEGSGGGNQLVQIEVKRLYNTTGASSVDWAATFLSNGTAGQDSLATSSTWYKAEASDFAAGQLFSGTLNFADGESSKFIDLNIDKDNVGETWFEHFLVTLSNPQAGVGSLTPIVDSTRGKYAYFIIDDDATDATNIPTFSVTADKTEGVEGTLTNPTTVTYTITRSGNTALPSQVAFSLTGLPNNSAFSIGGNASNVTGGHGVVNFTAGQTTKTVTVNWIGDKVVESDFTTVFALNAPGANQQGSYATSGIYTGITGYSEIADIGPGRISATNGSVNVIQKNDDVRLYISGYNGTRLTFNEDSPITFAISRAGKLDYDITLNWSKTNGTTTNADFSTQSGTILLPANQSLVNVSLPILVDDTFTENPTSDNFTFTLSHTNEHIRFGSSTIDTNLPQSADFLMGIIDNDQTYSITTSTSTVTETDTGSNQSVTVKLIRTLDNAGYQGATTLAYSLAGSGGNPADSADLVSTTGSVSLAADEKEKEFTLFLVKGDGKVESTESFDFTLTGVSSGKGTIPAGGSKVTINIADNDTGISISDAQITETEANQTMTFTITRNGVLTDPTSMNWSLAHISTSAADFEGTTSGTLNFAAGENSKTVQVTVKGDELGEGVETFEIRLTNFTNVDDPIKVTGTGTITDNDASFSIQSSVVEVQESGGFANFTVTRSNTTPQNQTISYTVSGTGTDAADATDFGGTFPTGTITFSGNELTKTIAIPIASDTTSEADETFKVTIATGAGASGDPITVSEGTGKILNDDAGLRLAVATPAVTEGSGTNGTFSFQVNRTGVLTGTATVDWSLDFTGMTASANDFTGPTSGTVTFAANESTKTVTVSVLGDSAKENNETFKVKLTNGSIPINVSEQTGTINDDDYAISLADASVSEGHTGSTATTFTATRTGNLTPAATLNWQVQAGTATANDFATGVLPSGTLTFNSGSSTAVFTVNLAGDSVFEADETYSVVLSGLTDGGSFTRDTATGTITNDDSGFNITAGNNVFEGTTSTSTAQFTVTRSGPTNQAATVQWALDSSSTVSADDTTGATSGTLTFGIGATTATISISLAADRHVESDETLVVKLSNASAGHGILTDSATVTVLNDDTDVKVTLIANALEGDTGTSHVGFRVTREGYLGETDTINFTTSNGSSSNADFLNGTLPTGSVSFIANQATADFNVSLAPDTIAEEDETFLVTITGTKAWVDIAGPTAIGTILNDDDQISFSTVSVEKAEGNDPQTPTTFTYTVQRTNGSGATSVQWTVAGSGTNAASNDDFTATTGTLTFADGETSKDLIISVNGDTTAEVNEDFTVTLSSPASGSVIAADGGTATGTILGDEPGIRIRAIDSALAEGNTNAVGFRFEVMRTGDISQASTIGYNVTGSGTHAADAHDFGGILPSGNVVFAAGESLKTLYVGVLSDTVGESDEEFTVSLTNTAGMHIFSDSAKATITNDDSGVRVVALQTTVKEGHSGNTALQYRVELLGTPNGTVSGTYKVVGVGDHPVSADDFAGGVLPTGNFSLDATTTSSLITLNILGDTNVGSHEKFQVILENVAGSHVVETDTTTTIQDDDSLIALKTGSLTITESNETQTMNFELERTGAVAESASVHWRLVPIDGNGVDAQDFLGGTLPGGTITFAANQTAANIGVHVLGDSKAEATEGFRVELYDPGAGVSISPGKQTAEGFIHNDDQELHIAGVDSSHKEGNEFNDPFTFDITRTGKVDQALTVNWQVVAVNGSASADASDFSTSMSGSFTWQANELNHRLTLQNVADTINEQDEVFRVEVSATGVATVGANGTILNDDSGSQSLVRVVESSSSQTSLLNDAHLATSSDLDSWSDSPAHIFLSAGRIDTTSVPDFLTTQEDDQDLSMAG